MNAVEIDRNLELDINDIDAPVSGAELIVYDDIEVLDEVLSDPFGGLIPVEEEDEKPQFDDEEPVTCRRNSYPPEAVEPTVVLTREELDKLLKSCSLHQTNDNGDGRKSRLVDEIFEALVEAVQHLGP